MSSYKDFVVPTAVLTIICLIISFSLVFTYQLTAPIIEKTAQAEADAARATVLEGATSFQKITLSNMPEGGVDIYKADNGAGYVITTQTKGYGGMMNVMTGIKSDGTISSVKLMENSETVGVGSKTGEAGFSGQFHGKNAKLENVDTISGATISSKAFIKAVQTAYQVYDAAKEVK